MKQRLQSLFAKIDSSGAWLAVLILLIPLGFTYYAWKATADDARQDAYNEFKLLAQENEKALLHRMDTYNYALLGGAGFFQGSEFVSKDEWHDYIETMNISQNFPGINGVGFISPVPPPDLSKFLQNIRADGLPNFIIHPHTDNKPYYIIKYLEPHDKTTVAIGLNISFEQNRQNAAELSRDTGKPAITKKIILVDDKEKTPGFYLLYPMYDAKKSIQTLEERRKASKGWIYAPFIAKNFLRDLTNSQSNNLHLEIYDGDKTLTKNLIFSNQNSDDIVRVPEFTVTKTIMVMQQPWTLVWKSTENFEKQSHSNLSSFYPYWRGDR